MSNTFGTPLFGQSISGQPASQNSYGVGRTYGQVRRQLTEEFPGASLDLLDDHLTNRFRTIIMRLDWQELEQVAVMQTVAPFSAGLATFTPGNDTVTLSDNAAWGGAQNGLLIRANGDSTLYTLTVQGPNIGILDRAYAGMAVEAVPVGYQILCPYYGLPTITRALLRMQMLNFSYPLTAVSQEYLDSGTPARIQVAPPRLWAPAPPRGVAQPLSPQLELYPVPDATYDIQYTFLSDFAAFGPNDTELYFPKLLDIQCLLAGIRADLLAVSNIQASAAHEALFEKRLMDMMVADGRRKPLERMGLADFRVEHREARYLRRHGNVYCWNDQEVSLMFDTPQPVPGVFPPS